MPEMIDIDMRDNLSSTDIIDVRRIMDIVELEDVNETAKILRCFNA